MKKLPQYLMILGLCLVFQHAHGVQILKAQKRGENASGCTPLKFTSLNKYKGDGWSKIFSDRQISPVLKTTLKGDYDKLKSNLVQADYPDSLSFIDSKGIFALQGAVPGLYTIMEAKLIVEPCGNIYAAVLDQGERILYFTNDRRYNAELPPAIENWKADLEKRRRQSASTKIADLPVVFKNK